LSDTRLRASIVVVVLAILVKPSLNAADGEGRVTITPDFSVAGMAGTWTVTFTAGPGGLGTGGSIRIELPTGWSDARFSEPQFTKPAAAHYTTIRTSSKTAKLYRHLENYLPLEEKRHWFRRVIYVGVQEGEIAPGETITVVYGDTAGGKNPGSLGPRFVNDGIVVVVSDQDGDGQGKRLAETPHLVTRAADPVEMQLIAASQAVVGRPVEVQINITDRFGNLVTDYAGEVRLSAAQGQVRPDRARFAKGSLRVEVIPERIGFLRIEARGEEKFGTPLSNPINVVTSQEKTSLYWGDIHSHSGISEDGSGGDPFPYARDVSRLDFYSLTDHLNVRGEALNNMGKVGNDYGEGVLPNEWKWTREQVDRYYRPGRFVTLLAFEYTLIWPWGHHNVYYRDNKRDYFIGDKVPTTEALWAALDEKGTFTIPHHTGIDWNDGGVTSAAVEWRTRNDRMRPSIEVYSVHGQSEMYDSTSKISYEISGRIPIDGPHYARDGWLRGHRMAVIASSDNHTSQPGQRHYGLAAVRAPGLTREAIFDALRSRRSYGTTGERIWMEFKVEDHDMGEEFQSRASQPKITFRVAGTDTVDFVEVVKLDLVGKKYERLGVLNPGSQDCDGAFWDKSFKNDSMYYLRLRQQKPVRDREVWAWSSPVWVRKADRQVAAGWNPTGWFAFLASCLVALTAKTLRREGKRRVS
jgi:Protein of unknown function (DUF3604)